MQALLDRWGIREVPTSDERWKLVERILASDAFHRAPQLRDILVYVAARSLAESPVTISEQEIGSLVLGRGPDFDPGHDNIVRAQMRHLRLKLAEYFSGEGRSEPVLVTIPKGHYVARFEPRPLPTAREPRQAGGAPEAPGAGGPSIPIFRKGRRVAVVAVLAAAAGFLTGRLAPREPPLAPKGYSIYDDVLGPGIGADARETVLVLGNPVVLLYAGSPSKEGKEIGAGAAIRIPPKLARQFESAINRADKAMPYRLLQIKTNDYTGLGDATGCFYLGGLLRTLGRQLVVTQARFLSWDSALRRNLIILGSPHINEWADANIPRHDYTIVKMGIENRNPRRGEPSIYREKWDSSGNPVLDHGLIWAWKTPAGSRVLVLAGPSSAATGAMAQLFADPERFRPIYEKLKADTPGGGFPSDWQVLFRVDIRDNLPIKVTYLNHRIYAPLP